LVTQAKNWTFGHPRTQQAELRRVTEVLESAAPALLYGARVWAGICLALYVAFWLQLDNPYWAGVTVAIVCQPSLGASLRKAWYYIVGTTIGAVTIVALTAFFPQNRFGFLVGLALWSAACGFVSTMLRNFAAFAAALAGYTAAIIASGELGATGGASEVVFVLAVTRASDICIGIISAALVLSLTDFGAASRRLSAQLAMISADIVRGLSGAFSRSGPTFEETRSRQRDLGERVAALDRVIDEAIGESSNLRLRSSILQGAVGGLFAALSGWRTAAFQLTQLPFEDRRRDALAILRELPPELQPSEATNWAGNALRARRACVATIRALTAGHDRSPSLRLLADQAAEALIGVGRALDGLLLLNGAFHAVPGKRRQRFYAPDWLPCLVNSARVFVTIGAVELFWVATAWPNGSLSITFASIYVLLFTLQGDQVHATAANFLIGVGITAASAAVIKFAVLPHIETFAGFSLAIGLVLVPAGAVIAWKWRPAIFTFVTIFFVLLLAPENEMVYDTQQFYNVALAMLVGLSAAAIAFRLVPPLSPALRTRRLLFLTSRDLRRLTNRPAAWTARDWTGRMYSRLSAVPAQAGPVERARLFATLSLGTQIIRLHRMGRRLHLQGQVESALQAMTRGDRSDAAEQLTRIDRVLAARPYDAAGALGRIRARGSILAISEALAPGGGFFGAGAADELH
jgi:uncharacterized membrane protein YccC